MQQRARRRRGAPRRARRAGGDKEGARLHHGRGGLAVDQVAVHERVLQQRRHGVDVVLAHLADVLEQERQRLEHAVLHVQLRHLHARRRARARQRRAHDAARALLPHPRRRGVCGSAAAQCCHRTRSVAALKHNLGRTASRHAPARLHRPQAGGARVAGLRCSTRMPHLTPPLPARPPSQQGRGAAACTAGQARRGRGRAGAARGAPCTRS